MEPRHEAEGRRPQAGEVTAGIQDAARMDLAGVRVLLVEDSARVRGILGTFLRREGANVVATASGREALAIARRHEFDFVLTDLGLPDVPGETLIQQIAETATRRPQVVVITGADEPQLTRARQAGAEAVFSKPLDWDRLLAYLRHRKLAGEGSGCF
jgi:CheY-like chemotaxis protein